MSAYAAEWKCPCKSRPLRFDLNYKRVCSFRNAKRSSSCFISTQVKRVMRNANFAANALSQNVVSIDGLLDEMTTLNANYLNYRTTLDATRQPIKWPWLQPFNQRRVIIRHLPLVIVMHIGSNWIIKLFCFAWNRINFITFYANLIGHLLWRLCLFIELYSNINFTEFVCKFHETEKVNTAMQRVLHKMACNPLKHRMRWKQQMNFFGECWASDFFQHSKPHCQ